MRKLTLLLLLLTLLTVFLGCGGGQQASSGGSGSEIVGVVQTTDAEEGSTRYARADTDNFYAPIYMLKRTHKGTGRETPETSTDPSDSSFRIAYAEPGQYLIEAVDTSTKKSLVRYVAVTGDGKRKDLGYMHLEYPKSIVCTVELPQLPSQFDNLPIKYRVYVLGTRVFAEGNKSKLGLNLTNIPLGETHHLQFEMLEPLKGSKTEKVDISSISSFTFNIKLDDLNLF